MGKTENGSRIVAPDARKSQNLFGSLGHCFDHFSVELPVSVDGIPLDCCDRRRKLCHAQAVRSSSSYLSCGCWSNSSNLWSRLCHCHGRRSRGEPSHFGGKVWPYLFHGWNGDRQNCHASGGKTPDSSYPRVGRQKPMHCGCRCSGRLCSAAHCLGQVCQRGANLYCSWLCFGRSSH